MRRFMHLQSCGKLRPIDDGRSSGHNQACAASETIFTTSPDFVTAASKSFLSRLRESDADMPEWASLCFGTDDMASAYRQLPNREDEAPGLVLAFWNPYQSKVQFGLTRMAWPARS